MKTLAIGYGNTLRSDDGAGYRVAETVADWQHPELDGWASNQLLPEMAATLAEVEQAIFIDARADVSAESSLECRWLEPQAQTIWTHHLEPPALLALAQQLYGRQPRACWLLIPAADFSFGETFSAQTQAGIDQALAKIAELAELPPEVTDA